MSIGQRNYVLLIWVNLRKMRISMEPDKQTSSPQPAPSQTDMPGGRMTSRLFSGLTNAPFPPNRFQFKNWFFSLAPVVFPPLRARLVLPLLQHRLRRWFSPKHRSQQHQWRTASAWSMIVLLLIIRSQIQLNNYFLRYVHTVPLRWSLPVGVSGARLTTNHMNLPPRTHKHAVWLASACTGIWFDWLALPSTLEKLTFSQLSAKWTNGTTMQFGKAWRHPIQSQWEASLLKHATEPYGRYVTPTLLLI